MCWLEDSTLMMLASSSLLIFWLHWTSINCLKRIASVVFVSCSTKQNTMKHVCEMKSFPTLSHMKNFMKVETWTKKMWITKKSIVSLSKFNNVFLCEKSCSIENIFWLFWANRRWNCNKIFQPWLSVLAHSVAWVLIALSS